MSCFRTERRPGDSVRPGLKARASILLVALAGVGGSLAAADPNWAQWRGPAGQGVSADGALPSTWSPTSQIAWKTPIPGRAFSSPIVWGDRIFLTNAIEGGTIAGHTPLPHTIGGRPWRHPDAMAGDKRHTFQVISLDSRSGRVLWTQTAYEGPVYDDRHRKSSYAAPTPVTDGQHVYAWFGTEGLYAYTFDGTLAWKAVLGKIAGQSVGIATSPLLFEQLVIVQADEDNGDLSAIVALDKATGREVWRTPRLGLSVSWGTPVLATSSAGPQLVTAANERIVSYDPRSGRELWREAGLDSNAVPSPVLAGDLAIVAAGYPTKKVVALRLSPAAGQPRRAWEYNKGTAYVISPIVYDGYLYLSTDNGLLTCLDARTGEMKYEGGRPPVPATFMASPVAFGGHIFMTSEDGETFVIKAGPVHEIVRTNSVGEPVFASMALAGGTVYLRGERHLFAIRARQPVSTRR
jgi:outer membrane protein assembly factor BamB